MKTVGGTVEHPHVIIIILLQMFGEAEKHLPLVATFFNSLRHGVHNGKAN